MSLTLRQQITCLALLAGLLPVLTVAGLVTVQKTRTSARITGDMDQMSRENTRQIAMDIAAMCRTIHELTQRQLSASLNAARDLVALLGQVHLGTQSVRWTATDEGAKAGRILELPQLLIGDKPLTPNADPKAPSPIVDEVARITGVTCSVFQRVNEEGAMLRVSTTVQTAEGTRAIGTILKHAEADGAPSPIVGAVLRGQVYRGCSRVLGTTYVTCYEALINEAGRVIGMLGVGANPDELAELRSAVVRTKVGRTGYVYVLVGTGPQRGSYVISKNGSQDGVNIWDMRDESGRLFIQSIVDKATRLKPGEVDYERYPWRNPDEPASRMKIAAFCYFEPWDWVIAAGMYEEDYYAAAWNANDALSQLLRDSLLAGAVVLLLVGGASVWLGRQIAAPITRLTAIAQKVAEGDVRAAEAMAGSSDGVAAPHGDSDAASRDETTQLVRAIRRMTVNLRTLLGQAQHTSVELLSSATEISAAAKQQEASLSDLGTSTNQIAAAVKEISATSQELVKTMSQVTSVANDTAGLANLGRRGLSGLEERMKELAGATQSVSSKLAVINDKTNNISTITTTIGKVADQTNLLSLNAAIEAEKAGEQGLGFSVVAREIRRLADQAAVATLDIEQMVKEMRSAVSSGVMEMDKFGEAMRRSVQETGQISAQLGQIIAQVQELTPRFQAVGEGMQSQSQGAQQINEAMTQLTGVTRDTLASLREFNKATEHMRGAVQGLKDEISRFKVST